MKKIIPFPQQKQPDTSILSAMQSIEKRFGMSFWAYMGFTGNQEKVKEKIDKVLHKETLQLASKLLEEGALDNHHDENKYRQENLIAADNPVHNQNITKKQAIGYVIAALKNKASSLDHTVDQTAILLEIERLFITIDPQQAEQIYIHEWNPPNEIQKL
ncbi:hypothetical protein [Paenibacillus radicis (ex Xue et al. 2023)]|uniref:DUF3231 family protein n=1 Tax=Paenibacillus radicis (ex Xue et al. 2023) TaxID=2972489 RepID=A0ABT1YVH4_9BACL|nr:hypothetical protein [Paenibacillus radicis (ex Xue et al. 2023)]MCR8636957.1 hypothetical protein [Paenibacillus radicis (ex Xue et al. 2023)]